MQPVWKPALLGAVLLTPALLLLYYTTHSAIKRPPVLIIPSDKRKKNLNAFLLLIQYAEGTLSNNAYRTLFGGGLFYSYAQHPNQSITKSGITSTAAGAYQFLYKTWEALQQSLGLPDFSPVNQDKAAIELIHRKGALVDVLEGRIATAINKCRKVWASFPGAGYGQGEQSLQVLLQVYQSFGGTITT